MANNINYYNKYLKYKKKKYLELSDIIGGSNDSNQIQKSNNLSPSALQSQSVASDVKIFLKLINSKKNLKSVDYEALLDKIKAFVDDDTKVDDTIKDDKKTFKEMFNLLLDYYNKQTFNIYKPYAKYSV